VLSGKKKAFFNGDIRVKILTPQKRQPHQPGGAADGGWKREFETGGEPTPRIFSEYDSAMNVPT
jgi:hypothetical protein